MKRVHRIGLVTAGKITGLWIEKTLELKRSVGPVYSTSLRLASRASNTLLRTGFHTTDWEELRRCEAVLFFLPAKSFHAMARNWIEAGHDLAGQRFVVCDAELGLADLADLRAHGALTATLGPLPYQETLRFVGEGDPAALAPAVKLLEADSYRFTRLNPGGKHRLAEAVDHLETSALPIFARSVESLRESGLTHEIAVGLAERCFGQMLRLYARNGRRAWDSRDVQHPPDAAAAPGQDLLALEDALVRERVAQALAATAGSEA
ncbi:MAG: hypothetical protein K2X03_31235 [Bryobacteraceae bacterium]|nr:hypothetical protein [Bryobacteraceae bacterium]